MAWWDIVDYDVEKVRNWIAEGKTQEWIGNHYNVHGQTVAKWCKKHGIKCQRTGPRDGAGHPDWKGGRRLDEDGYILVYSPNHPYARKPRKKYVLEHRLVMEEHLGRYLFPQEVVHHKNGKRNDNRIENLELFSKNSEHLKHELTGHVPNWTEDGKLRIRLANLKSARIRRELKLDDSLSTKTSPLMIA